VHPPFVARVGVPGSEAVAGPGKAEQSVPIVSDAGGQEVAASRAPPADPSPSGGDGGGAGAS
jgi:hypothetical protein